MPPGPSQRTNAVSAGPPASLLLGLRSLRQHRFDEAVDLLRDAVRRDSVSADTYHSLAFALTGAGHLDEAIRVYRKALKMRPGFPQAHNNLGFCLQRLGRHADALPHFDRALSLDPDYAEAMNNRGNTLQALGRMADAARAYQAALAIAPDHSDAQTNLTGILARLGYDAESGDERFQEPDPETLIALGKAFTEANDFLLARRAFRRARARGRETPEVLFGIGLADAHLGLTEEAATSLRGLFNAGVKSDRVIAALAALPGSIVEVDLLVEIEQGAGSGNRHSPTLAFARGQLLSKAGRHAEAWDVLVEVNREIWKTAASERAERQEREQRCLARFRSDVPDIADDGSAGTTLMILGASRSGKTTAEALAGQFRDVVRGYENNLILDALYIACRQHGIVYDGGTDSLPAACSASFRDNYLQVVSRRTGGARIFTTTSPGLMRLLPLIAETLPNLRFLMVKRNPDDNVLRMFMKQYRSGNSYSYNVAAAYAHLAWYNEMIDLCRASYPEITRVVTYEEMIEAPLATRRSIADLCGIPEPDEPVPPFNDDRGCAGPYRSFLAAAR
jgi:Flp pilus assembly protein TadD